MKQGFRLPKRARAWIMLLSLFGGMSLLGGCHTIPDVITEHPRNYRYVPDESIRITAVEDGALLGELTVHGFTVLSDEPFTVQKRSGTDESGNPTFETVTYAQLVQIHYTAAQFTARAPQPTDFRVTDATGEAAWVDPDVAYTAEPAQGTDSFVAALPHAGDALIITYYYGGGLTPTATVSFAVPSATSAPMPSASVSAPENSGSGTSTGIPAPSVNAEPPVGKINVPVWLPIALLSVIGVLLAAVVVLTWLLHKARRR